MDRRATKKNKGKNSYNKYGKYTNKSIRIMTELRNKQVEQKKQEDKNKK